MNVMLKENKKYRNEWKYICHINDLTLIENKLQKTILKDKHVLSNNIYIIHSLYFDDYTNSCMFDNDAGLGNRYKWRIRYYNDDLSYICLEKKEKSNGMCRKNSCKLTIDEYNMIINNEISELYRCTDKKLLLEFCVDINTRLFMPKIIVDYERTAYVEPISNVRITIDKNISASKQLDRFLTNDYIKHPLQGPDYHILEIKFDDILPSYIKQAAQTDRLNQTTFSKYYLSRTVLEENII